MNLHYLDQARLVVRRSTLRAAAAASHRAAAVAVLGLMMLTVQECLAVTLSWSGESGWFLLTLSLTMIAAVSTYLHWHYVTCLACVRSHPLNPAAEIRHFRHLLWVYHRGGWLGGGFLSVYFTIAVAGHAHLGSAALALPLMICANAGAAVVIVTMNLHRGVSFWCPRCDEHAHYLCSADCTQHLHASG